MTNEPQKAKPLKDLLRLDDVRGRFEDALKERAGQFMTSVLTVVNSDSQLKECHPYSIINACLIAASLDLPIEKNLGQAWIIPYRSKEGMKAQFQMGWKGYVQLAIRTAQYTDLNATEVYAGERVMVNRLTGRIEMNGKAFGDEPEVTGYVAYLKLHNGFEKALYMSQTDMLRHMKKYSKRWERRDSAWITHPHEMGKKVVITALLRRWGLLSIQMQKAIIAEDTEALKAGDVTLITEDSMIDMTPEEGVPVETIPVAESPDPAYEWTQEQPAPNGVAPGVPAPTPAPDILPPGMPAIPLKPAPAPAPETPDPYLVALVHAGVAENISHAARVANLLGIDKTISMENAITLGKIYRGWRDQDRPVEEAASLTKRGQIPR